jgi:hypothetical protein
MGLVLYVFFAVALVLVLGWAVYVLPVRGELNAWQLAGALVPALGFLAAVLAVAAAAWLVGRVLRRRRRD